MNILKEGVQPPLTYTPPRLDPAVLNAIRLLGPWYVRKVLGIEIGEIRGAERLIEEYRGFEAGESRLIIAFRHVNVDDAQVMFTVLNNLLPAEARRRKIRFKRRPHAHFIYARGVPIWKGRWLTWLFSKLGAAPVARDALVRSNIEIIRNLLENGSYPVAMAPEAQVTYHNEIVYPLEPGFAQFAIWALKSIADKSHGPQVRILPVALHYRYGRNTESTFEEIIADIESVSGFRVPMERWSAGMRSVLEYAGGKVLDRCAAFYRRFYGIEAGGRAAARKTGEDENGPGPFTRRRAEGLTDAALRLLERRLGVRSRKESFLSRILAVKQACWGLIFRKGVDGNYGTNPLRDDLDDFIAGETSLLMRHIEVADIMSYMHPEYALQSEEPNRWVEMALNIHDVTNRLRGGTIGERRKVHPAIAQIRIGDTIPLSASDLPGQGSERKLREHIITRTADELRTLSGEQ
jgi:hypothetical protein